MIQHVVMLSLQPDVPPADLARIMAGLDRLRDVLSGFVAFQHGPNRDFEAKSPGYSYGFVCTFTDKDALQTYADHPEHKLLGADLVAICKGGGDGIWVADIDAG